MADEDGQQLQLPVRRTLTEHNPGTSPVKTFSSANSSPRVTPTKGANPYGDRFIPLRQPNSEWNARYCAIASLDADAALFKRPMANSARSNVGHDSGQSAGYGSGSNSSFLQQQHPQSPYSSQYHGSSTGTPTIAATAGYQVQQVCYEEQRRDEMVVRALLRNEMLKDRIDDFHVFPTDDSSNFVTGPQQTSSASGSNSNASSSTRVSSPTFQMLDGESQPGPQIAQPSQRSTSSSACADPPRSQGSNSQHSSAHSSPARTLFSYSAKTTPNKYGPASTSVNVSPFSGPLGEESQRLLKTPRKPQRRVSKNPYKVLDAPELQDDFYLNLVDWSSQNVLSVGLSSCVYLWSAHNCEVTKLCDLQADQDTVTSVQWAEKGDLLAVGTNRGVTQIWDVVAQKKIRDLAGHQSRIGCLAWNADAICSGSRDRTIIHRDIRTDDRETPRKLTTHRQEVCGLKWSPDKQLLASGGNDNQLLVWNLRRNDPVQTYTEHCAAVKALAWSPHHHGLLVSGGGTADRCLRFWNTLTSQPMQYIDTCSQVCNVAWSKHSNELVTTHGYSYNHVIIWKYPSLQPVIKLVGHQYRVLYLAMSPDGESIVTGAGDETLRFWHVFNKSGAARVHRSKLNLLTHLR